MIPKWECEGATGGQTSPKQEDEAKQYEMGRSRKQVEIKLAKAET